MMVCYYEKLGVYFSSFGVRACLCALTSMCLVRAFACLHGCICVFQLHVRACTVAYVYVR